MALFCGCATVREEIKPARETTLITARSGENVTLSWIAVRGEFYSIMYMDKDSKSRWNFLEGAVNLTGMTGENMLVYDMVPASRQRFYRINVSPTPITSTSPMIAPKKSSR